ncbi:hypothetical protein [Plesiocystis pacifica]|nr:hypothetical protein [Plesiocystis pacifica]
MPASNRLVSSLFTSSLIAAAMVLGACSDDGGGEDEAAGTEDTGEDEESTDEETTDEGGECTPPPEDTQEFGTQQYVEVVNGGAAAVYIKGGPCGAAIMELEIDGEPWRDNTALFERCSTVVENDYCEGSCAPEDGLVPSIRIGAGESLFLPFDGVAYVPHPIADACQALETCPPPSECQVASIVPDGASMTVIVTAYDTCSDPMACGCDMAETCEMANVNVHSAISGGTVTGSVTLTYPDAGQPVLMLQLAGFCLDAARSSDKNPGPCASTTAGSRRASDSSRHRPRLLAKYKQLVTACSPELSLPSVTSRVLGLITPVVEQDLSDLQEHAKVFLVAADEQIRQLVFGGASRSHRL